MAATFSDKKQQGGCTISFTVPVFSMENLIAPLLRQGPVAGNCFFLVSVKVFLEKNWASARDRATALASIQKVISRCILPDLDVSFLLRTHRTGLSTASLPARAKKVRT